MDQKRIEELLSEIRRIERRIQFYDKGFSAWVVYPTRKKSSIKNKNDGHWNRGGYSFETWFEDARECILKPIHVVEIPSLDVKQGNFLHIDNCSHSKDFGHVDDEELWAYWYCRVIYPKRKKSSIKNKNDGHWNHGGYNFDTWLEDARECTLRPIPVVEIPSLDVKQGNFLHIDNCSHSKDFRHVDDEKLWAYWYCRVVYPTRKKFSIKKKNYGHWNCGGYNFETWLKDARERTLKPNLVVEISASDAKLGNFVHIDNCSHSKDLGHVDDEELESKDELWR